MLIMGHYIYRSKSWLITKLLNWFKYNTFTESNDTGLAFMWHLLRWQLRWVRSRLERKFWAPWNLFCCFTCVVRTFLLPKICYWDPWRTDCCIYIHWWILKLGLHGLLWFYFFGWESFRCPQFLDWWISIWIWQDDRLLH